MRLNDRTSKTQQKEKNFITYSEKHNSEKQKISVHILRTIVQVKTMDSHHYLDSFISN